MRSSILAAAVFVTVFSAAEEKPSELDADTVSKLKSFIATIDAFPKSDDPDEKRAKIVNEIGALSKKIPDEKLAAVEAFALSEDGAQIQWLLGYLLIDRKKYDAASHIFVVSLAAIPQDRSYRMWKWWETSFVERKDYMALTRDLGIALVRQFEIGNAEHKQVVAELFGKSGAEAKLSVAEFKKAIDFDNKIVNPPQK